jgi:WD40 repeat protein
MLIRVKGSVKNDSSKVHKGTITCACVVGDVVLSAGYDNAVRAHSTASGDLAGEGTSANGQPKQLVASASGVVVMMTSQGIALVSPAGVVSGFLATTGKTPLCVAINPEGTEVAMGCSETQDITVYAIAGGAFTETMPAMTMRGKVTALAYSPDGATLAAGDDQCQVMIWKTEDRSRLLAKWSWGRHGSKIACLSWSPDGTRVASGSGDNHIFLWKPSEARGYLQIPRAHPEGVVDVGFTADDVLASVGRDGALRKWKIA